MAWPSTLPQHLEVQNFSGDGPVGGIRAEMDAGPAYQRQRFTAAPERFVGRMLLDATQFETLRTYWRDTLAHGTVSDTWEHPITGDAATVRFDATKPYRVTAASGRWFYVELQFEVLP